MFGNKSDLSDENKRVVTIEEAYDKIMQFQKNYGKSHKNLNIIYLGEASAKTTENIKKYINFCIEFLIEKAYKCKQCGLFMLQKNRPYSSQTTEWGKLEFPPLNTDNDKNKNSDNVLLPPWDVFES